jgi:hypothetical protein
MKKPSPSAQGGLRFGVCLPAARTLAGGPHARHHGLIATDRLTRSPRPSAVMRHAEREERHGRRLRQCLRPRKEPVTPRDRESVAQSPCPARGAAVFAMLHGRITDRTPWVCRRWRRALTRVSTSPDMSRSSRASCSCLWSCAHTAQSSLYGIASVTSPCLRQVDHTPGPFARSRGPSYVDTSATGRYRSPHTTTWRYLRVYRTVRRHTFRA